MKRFIAIILFVLFFILIGKGFHYLTVDDTASYTRLMMHEFYEQENIDVLLVGSSHCYAALDPTVTDAIFGMNSFNAGSSLQSPDASFALIREAVERCDVKQIYLEMYYFLMNNSEYKDREQLTGTYIISDYMRFSPNKVRFLLEASAPKYYINSFLPPRREWKRLLTPEAVIDLVRAKGAPVYRQYEPSGDYRGKGYVANQQTIPGEYLMDTAGFDRIRTENVSADWLRTIRNILDYCRQKGVKITLFSAPMTLFQTAAEGNYDDYIRLASGLAAEYGVEYVDFNLCRPEYFDFSNDCFSDAGHLNDRGAQVYSRMFADFFTGKIAKEDLFYDSMAEKLAALEPAFLGLSYLDSGDGSRHFKIVSTDPGEEDFVTVISPTGQSSQTVSGKVFSVPQEEHGMITVEGSFGQAEMEY